MLARVLAEGRDDLRAFADSRPWIVEAEAIARAAGLAEAAGCPLYVVHVTSRQGLAELVAAGAQPASASSSRRSRTT